jgi:hypothetical protein
MMSKENIVDYEDWLLKKEASSDLLSFWISSFWLAQ